MRKHAVLHLKDPDGKSLIEGVSLKEGTHIPREGERVKTTDQTESESMIPFTQDGPLVVSEVETEFRLTDNIGRGESWQQLIYVRTEYAD